MSISALSPVAQAGQDTNQTKIKKDLTQQDFMYLFITQLQNQNPLEPMDNNQLATQMSQFGSLEALNNMTGILQSIATYQASMNNLQVLGMIGKKVEGIGNSLTIDKGEVSEGYYQLSKPGTATIQIYDAQGNLVRTINAGVKDTSKQKLVWDGKNTEGSSLPDGEYTFKISAVDEKGQSITVDTYVVGTVTGVTFEDGVIYVNCGSKKMTISDIRAILA